MEKRCGYVEVLGVVGRANRQKTRGRQAGIEIRTWPKGGEGASRDGSVTSWKGVSRRGWPEDEVALGVPAELVGSVVKNVRRSGCKKRWHESKRQCLNVKEREVIGDE